MLRKIILAVAVLIAAVGVWLMSRQLWVPGMQALIVAAVIFMGTAFENWRYRKGTGPAGARWQKTEERFADPISGEEMQVQYDPASGERRYVKH